MADRWSTRLDVAWGDMDAFGHVNNAKYFTYFEIARILWFQAKGVMADGLRVGDVGPILASTSCRFKAPIAFPDTLEIAIDVVDVGEDRFSHRYAVTSEALGRVAATGEALVVAYNYAAGAKAPIPPSWKL